MAQTLTPVILSGGSGTRLWPLSRPERPKQLLPLVTARSLLQETLARLEGFKERLGAPIVVCNESHRFLVAEQLREQGIAPRAIVLEPEGRNTAPAAAVAAEVALARAGAHDDEMLLVLPADHVILDSARFCAAVARGLGAAAAGRLVTFGIVPDRPETGYGYIGVGASHGDWSAVAEFVEKPDLEAVESYLASGRYLWNSGIFLFSARAYLGELARYAPAMLGPCERALDKASRDADFFRLGAEFLDCPSGSIDHVVMERTEHAAIVPLDVGWSDVGSWGALYEVLDKDVAGNVLRGDVIAEGCRGCYIISTGRRIAVIGLEDCVVVETEDAVLVVPRDYAQTVRALVDRLTAK